MVEGEIYFITELAADLRAGDVSAAQGCEGEAHAAVQRVCAANECLKLILPQAVLVGHSSVEFSTQR